MTEDYKPTDNAIAERVNGILKTEVIFSDEKVNVFSTKSTNPGKGATKAGKQTTGSERCAFLTYKIQAVFPAYKNTQRIAVSAILCLHPPI